MNIFVLDNSVENIAKYQHDKHCVKMVLETAQLLSTAVRTVDENADVYKSCYLNHPCSLWVRESKANFIWTCQLGVALAEEYTFRYEKRHKSQDIIEKSLSYANKFPVVELTKHVLCMPEEYKQDSVVESYRDYYASEKAEAGNWRNRNKPDWLQKTLSGISVNG